MSRPVSTHSQSGISLLETLVALSIIAVMATTVIMMVDLSKSAEDEASDALVRSLNEARQEALVSAQIIGFAADPDGRGYRFFRYTDRNWRLERDHPAFEPVRFNDDIRLDLMEGAITGLESEEGLQSQAIETADAPQIWFDSAGFDTPFRYRLSGQIEAGFDIVRNDQGAIGRELVGAPS